MPKVEAVRAKQVSALDANRLGVLWSTLDQAMARAMEGPSASAAALLIWLQHWAPAGVVEVARVVGLSQPACTRALDRLAGQGLVARTPAGKSVQIDLTAQGRALARQLQKRRLDACASLLAALSPPEQRQFAALADKLLRSPVDSRGYARHVCRFCDHKVCDGAACPIGSRATELGC